MARSSLVAQSDTKPVSRGSYSSHARQVPKVDGGTFVATAPVGAVDALTDNSAFLRWALNGPDLDRTLVAQIWIIRIALSASGIKSTHVGRVQRSVLL